MDENNIYENEQETIEITKEELLGDEAESAETVTSEPASEDEFVIVEEETEQEDVEPEPVTAEPEQVKVREKKQIPGWLWSLIITLPICFLTLILCLIIGIFAMRASGVRYSHLPNASISISGENPFEELGKGALKSVVNIEGASAGYGGFFGQSFSRSSGTGVIISENGYIITSQYIVDNSNVTVSLQDGKEYVATVENVDNLTGVALLKIDAAGLTPIAIGDSSECKIGDRVGVIGNALHANLTNPIVGGNIAGINNSIPLNNGGRINIMQIDASTIAGSIGGIVLNTKGEMIGMATGMISNSSDEIGLVTPVNDMAELIGGIVEMKGKPAESELIIGISGSDESFGVEVTMVGEGTPAEKAGIKVGDLIVKVDGEAVTSIEMINEIKLRHQKGDTLILTVYRDGEMTDINVVLE